MPSGDTPQPHDRYCLCGKQGHDWNCDCEECQKYPFYERKSEMDLILKVTVHDVKPDPSPEDIGSIINGVESVVVGVIDNREFDFNFVEVVKVDE